MNILAHACHLCTGGHALTRSAEEIGMSECAPERKRIALVNKNASRGFKLDFLS